mmetsp:Transcript_27559/g.93794  ORF Transcript_27559/g.93794 Transcript_27559/m.93794 type:complete len:282 (-) Transcript_27559:140-985(-)
MRWCSHTKWAPSSQAPTTTGRGAPPHFLHGAQHRATRPVVSPPGPTSSGSATTPSGGGTAYDVRRCSRRFFFRNAAPMSEPWGASSRGGSVPRRSRFMDRGLGSGAAGTGSARPVMSASWRQCSRTGRWFSKDFHAPTWRFAWLAMSRKSALGSRSLPTARMLAMLQTSQRTHHEPPSPRSATSCRLGDPSRRANALPTRTPLSAVSMISSSSICWRSAAWSMGACARRNSPSESWAGMSSPGRWFDVPRPAHRTDRHVLTTSTMSPRRVGSRTSETWSPG